MRVTIIILLLLFIGVQGGWCGEVSEESGYLLLYTECSCDNSFYYLDTTVGKAKRDKYTKLASASNDIYIPQTDVLMNRCSQRCNTYWKIFGSVDELLKFCNEGIHRYPKVEAERIFKVEYEVPIELKVEKETVTREEEVIKSQEWVIPE